MNVRKAMIIKTNNDEQTEAAKGVRDALNELGIDVVLVPHKVTDLFITIENGRLTVLSEYDGGLFKVEDLDSPSGFNSVAECWDYARVIMREASLPEDSCDADVWDICLAE